MKHITHNLKIFAVVLTRPVEKASLVLIRPKHMQMPAVLLLLTMST